MEPEALRRAARALHYWERRQEVVANNLANAETPGFKGQRVFQRMLDDLTTVVGTRTSMQAGSVEETGRPLDVALTDGAFMVVGTGAGERLLRGGSLQVDPTGRLLDGTGNPVLGEEGEIVVPAGPIRIADDGSVLVDGAQVGRLRLETVADPATLVPEGGTLFAAQGTQPMAEDARVVRSGYLEQSNVTPLDSMVEMMTIQRSYAAVNNTVRVLDGVLDTIANDIGRSLG